MTTTTTTTQLGTMATIIKHHSDPKLMKNFVVIVDVVVVDVVVGRSKPRLIDSINLLRMWVGGN